MSKNIKREIDLDIALQMGGDSKKEATITKGKKGVSNVHLYPRNIRKEARRTGKAYLNSRGEFVPAKTAAISCGCKRNNCLDKWTMEERSIMLKQFCELETKDMQDLFLQKSCDIVSPKRALPSEVNTRPRAFSTKYYLSFGRKKAQVCKNGFLAVYGIKKKRMERILNLQMNNQIPQDMRGKNVTKNFSSRQIM